MATTFPNWQRAGALEAAPPLEIIDGVLTIPKADATHDGYLSKEDWSTFSTAAGGGISGLSQDVTTTAAVGGVAAATVVGINGQNLAALATGILRNTTGTGVPVIAVAADFPTLNQNTTGTSSGFTGPLAGDVGGTQSATVIGAGKVTNAMLAGSIAASKLIGTDIATVGTITTGTWSATTIAVAKGGTGLTAVGTANQLLSTNSSATDLEYRTIAFGSSGTDLNVAFGSGTITLNIPSASATARGVMTNGTQIFAGQKDFNDLVRFRNAGFPIYLGPSGQELAINVAPLSAPRTLTTPDADSVTVIPEIATTNYWVAYINSAGNQILTRPSFSSLSGTLSLSGDVTGNNTATVVSTVGGQTATNVAAGAVLANAATSANTASAIVRRDSNGVFAVSSIITNYVSLTSSLTPYVVLATDDIIFVDTSSSPNLRTIQLPNAPTTNRAITVIDIGGQASSYPITVTTVGGTVKISSATKTSYVINQSYQGICFRFNGTSYSATLAYPGQGNDGDLFISQGERLFFGNGTTGQFNFGNTTNSTSTSSGSLTISGGLGVLLNVYIGVNCVVQGTTDSSSSSTGTITTLGGIGAAKSIFSGANIVAQGSTNSTSSSTGSLRTSGGLGVALNANIGGTFGVASTTDASSSSSGGACTIAGGCAIAKKLFVGTGIYLPTSGGTKAELNYYEEYSAGITLTGPNGRTISSTMYLTRIGKIVSMVLAGGTSASGTGNSTATSSAGVIPSQMRPVIGVTAIYDAFVTGGGGEQAGKCDISTAGTMTLYSTVAGGTFNISGTSWGFATFMATWRVS